MLPKTIFVVLSFAVVHLSILTIQRRLALSLHKDDTLYKEIYHFFFFSKLLLKTADIFLQKIEQ